MNTIKNIISENGWGETHGLFMAAEHMKYNGLILLGHLTINSQSLSERNQIFMDTFQQIMLETVIPTNEMHWGLLENKYQAIVAFHLPGESNQLKSFGEKIRLSIQGKQCKTCFVRCKA